jgi:glucose/arabinose dehydrogenase
VASTPVTLLDTPILQSDPLGHHGGNIHFGEDGMLYISMGENFVDEAAQDMTIPQGKILRIDPDDGAAPLDNPFYDGDGPNDDRIWALGLRNPFDFDFDPFKGSIWVSDNGPGCGDEINYIVPGGNYGWPINSPSYFECIDPGDPFLPPAYAWTPTIAPTGITVHTGVTLADWHGNLMMCAWNTGLLYRFELNEDRTRIVAAEEIDVSPAACKLDVATGPDGSLYMTTRNGEIYRLKSRGLWLPLIY